MMVRTALWISVLTTAVAGCGSSDSGRPAVEATKRPTVTSDGDSNRLAELRDKPLYRFTERDVDAYLRHLKQSEPDLRRRIVHLARKNIEQPYELYLLGEAPFAQTDPQPIYCLGRSDCVVFAEHTLAMALTDDFPSFMTMLQRIRYKDGQIGVVTRNHYTEADWNRNNAWLVTDVTSALAGDAAVPFSQKVDRAKFLKGRYKLDETIAVETIEESFIPFERIDSVKPLLRDADVVNFVTGKEGGYWVGHVGLVALAPGGGVNLIHSAKPKVREEPIDAYIARMTKDAAADDAKGKARFRGFKFLRLTENPMANLRAIDGPGAPVVKLPAGSDVTWEKYLKSFELGG